MRFRWFVWELRWAFLLAAIALVILLTGQGINYGGRYSDHKDKIEFFQSFVLDDYEMHIDAYGKEVKPKKYVHLANAMRLFMRDVRHASPHDAISDLRSFTKWSYDNLGFIAWIAWFDGHRVELDILLNHPERIPELVYVEQVKIDAMEFDWMRSVRVARWVWVVVAFATVMIGWAAHGAQAGFFFWRAWWLWVFFVMILPLSPIILMAVGAGWVVRKVRNKTEEVPESYEAVCERLNILATTSRAAWIAYFEPKRMEERLYLQQSLVQELRKAVGCAGEELQKAETKYFESKEALASMAYSEDMRDFVENEFDQLRALPYIAAVEFDHNDLNIYTEQLPHLITGYTGPFRIRIETTHGFGSVGVYAAHETSRRNFSGGGYDGYYCFGTVRSLIDGHLCVYHICDAVGVMIQSFMS